MKTSLLKKIEGIISSLKITLPYLIGFKDYRKAITEEYPDKVSARMPEDLPAKYRGFVKNDVKKCIGCGKCVDVCPTKCITLVTDEKPESKKHISIYDIDNSKCIFCGLCINNCPSECLEHTQEYRGAVYEKEKLVFSFGEGVPSGNEIKKWNEIKIEKEKNNKWTFDL